MNEIEAFEAEYSRGDFGIEGRNLKKYPDGSYESQQTYTAFHWFKKGAALASQAQQESRSILVGKVNNKYGDPEAFAERSCYIDEQALQTVPIGYKLVAIPPAPEGEKE